MHILITGGEGYIGNYLAKSLLDDGHFVTTLDSHFSNKPYNFSQYSTKYIRRFNASVTNSDAVIRALYDVDIVYHLACRHDFENSYRHPMRISQTNVQGTCNLFCMANRAGVDKIIYTSDYNVYGNIVGSKETDSTIPVNMYGATKLSAEAICKGFYQRGFEVVILRIFNVWGRRNSRSVVNKFSNGNNVIYADGRQTRDFVYIDDVVTALRNSAQWESGIYNIGSGEETTIEGLYAMLNGKAEPRYKDFPVGYDEILRSCADISFTKQNTSWEASTKLSELDKNQVLELCQKD